MPRKIAIGPYDDFVVADKINNRIQVIIVCEYVLVYVYACVCVRVNIS